MKSVESIKPIWVKKVTAEEAGDQDPLILLSDLANKQKGQNLFAIGYTLASAYSRSLLGKPNNPYIKLREKDRELVAIRKFWGYPTPRKIAKEQAIFRRILERDSITPEEMCIAEYSPQWVFYFFRHNELIVPLKQSQL